MARKRGRSFSGARPAAIKFQGTETAGKNFLEFQIDRPSLSVEFEGFGKYLAASIFNTSLILAQMGVDAAREKLLDSDTPWGQARMRGEYFGVRFRPYGKGPGRYATGNMYRALRVLKTEAGGASGFGKITFGYDPTMDRGSQGEAYFRRQELGFKNKWAFDANETARTGKAAFTEGVRIRSVRGAFALPAGAEFVAGKIDAAFARAWDDAKRLYENRGFAVDNIGTYVDATTAYRGQKRPKFSTLRPDMPVGRSVSVFKGGLAPAMPPTLSQLESMYSQLKKLRG